MVMKAEWSGNACGVWYTVCLPPLNLCRQERVWDALLPAHYMYCTYMYSTRIYMYTVFFIPFLYMYCAHVQLQYCILALHTVGGGQGKTEK